MGPARFPVERSTGLGRGGPDADSGRCAMCRWGRSCEICREGQEESRMAQGSRKSEHLEGEPGGAEVWGVRVTSAPD